MVDPATGEARRAWVFVMVLGHSRHLSARDGFDQSVRTWIDCHVLFERRWTSVPWKHLGQEAWVRATPSEVEVFVDDRKVTAHPRQGPGLRSTLQHHLPEHRRDLAERSPGVWRARAEALGPEVAARLDLADLPAPVDAPAPGLDGSPKYARAIGELFLRHQGVTHGWN